MVPTDSYDSINAGLAMSLQYLIVAAIAAYMKFKGVMVSSVSEIMPLLGKAVELWNRSAVVNTLTADLKIPYAGDKEIGAAYVILGAPRFGDILTLINVSKSVILIWLNFAWSFINDILAILLGAGAFVPLGDVQIPPEFAGLGEIVSVLPVIAMAVQQRWEKGRDLVVVVRFPWCVIDLIFSFLSLRSSRCFPSLRVY
ncbi:hypothetical protein B0H67DRAFT_558437 [Lasiosphaeris hirsuta]|uniref:Uncharacterized protein n=1 Tax=Lasiosphaeris hirsuta TaxID=260670 RepID=A0AA40DH14_9PEZI|nr:hypothetical protein B0H67DRAFT_558437 [Lasiosphaeris hirsuta]